MRRALCLELVELPLARQVESKRVVSITKDSLGPGSAFRSDTVAMSFPNDSRIPSRVALSCNFNHSLLFCESEKTLQLLKTLDGTTHLVLKPHETLWVGVIFTNGASPSFHGSRRTHANLEWNSL